MLPLFLNPITCARAIIPLFWLAFDPPHRSSSPQPSLFIFQSHIFPSFLLLKIHQPATSSPGYLWHCCSVPLHSTHSSWLLPGMFCFVLLLLVVLSSSLGYSWHCCSVPLQSTWLIVACGMFCFVLFLLLWFYYRRHIHLCYMMYLSKLSLPSNYSLGENNYYHWRISLSTIATSPAIGTL